MSNTISEAVLVIRTDVDQMKRGFAEMEQRFKQFGETAKAAGKQTDTFSAAMGKLSPVLAAFGVSLSAAAIVSFGKSLLDTAGRLSDLRDATGVSVQDLQKLGYIGVGVGVDMDQLGRAVGTLSERLASGDKSATGAVAKLGLNLDKLLAAGPKEAFVQIGDAVGKIADPMEKNAIAADLFGGKLARNLIPLLGNLREEMEKVPKDSLISDSMIAQADKMGDAWDRLLIKAKAYAFSGLGTLGLGHEDAVGDVGATIKELDRLGVHSGKIFDDWNAHLAKQVAETAGQIAAAEKAALLGPGFVAGLQQGAEAIDAIHAAFLKDAQEAAKKAAAELVAFRVKLNDVIKASYTGKEAMSALAQGLDKVGQEDHDLDALIQHFKDLNTEMKNAAASVQAVSLAWPSAVQTMSAALGGSELPVVRSTVGMIGTLAPALRGITTESKHSSDGLRDLAQAFGTLAQISGGSFGGVVRGMGEMIGAINVAQTAMSNLSKAVKAGTDNWGDYAQAATGYIAAVSVGLNMLYSKWARDDAKSQSIFDEWTNDLRQLGERRNDVRYSISVDQLGEIDALFNRLTHLPHQNPFDLNAIRETAAAIDVILAHIEQVSGEASSRFGPSHSELVALAQDAHDVFDFMQASGEFSPEQLSKAFLAFQQALADAGNAAAQAWLKVHDPIEAAAAASNAALDDLKAQFKSLADSVAGEAPEENMGVIESQTRAQMAVLADQIEQTSKDLETQANEAADAFETAMAGIDPEIIDVPWQFVQVGEGLGGGGATKMANGGFGVVERPTLFLAGERGREEFAFSGANRKFGGGGDTGGTVVLNLDGREIARATFPHLYDTVQAYGLGR